MNQNKSPSKWRHFEPVIILLCVRWYYRYRLSYRDLEERMRERGLSEDYVTSFRWVRRCAPEINKRVRPHLKMSGASYRLDETYVKVGGEGKYLYRRLINDPTAGRFGVLVLKGEQVAGTFESPAIKTSRPGRSELKGEKTPSGIAAAPGVPPGLLSLKASPWRRRQVSGY